MHIRRGAFARPHKRSLLAVTGLALASVLAVLPGSTPTPVTEPLAAAAAAPRPNFVVIITDDMRADELKYMPKTRRLLVANGRSYTQALSPHPLCCPARAELITGQYAQNNGVRHNADPKGGFDALRLKGNTLATWLRDTGYRTGFVGKYLNGYTQADGWQGGWSKWQPLVSGLYHYRKFRFFRETGYSNDYVTSRISQKTVRMIHQFHDARRPFLVMTSHVAPHQRTINGVNYNPVVQSAYRSVYADAVNPARGKPSYNEADVTDKPAWVRRLPQASTPAMQSLFHARIRSLRSVDDAVGRIVTALAQTGELANTYIVFTSDNGFSLGEHRHTSKNRLVEEDLRVPLVIRGPGIPRGTSSARLATLLDVPVTISHLARVTPRRRVDGQSLQRSAQRDTVLIQHGGSAASTGGTQWSWRGVRTSRYSWAVNTRNPVEETLFDHQRDPYELTNVARDPRYAQVRLELRRRYSQLAGCSGPACNPVFGAEPQPTG